MATPHKTSTASPDTAQHEHGTMNITAQQRTFDGFIRLAIWTAVLSIAVLIFMALTNA